MPSERTAQATFAAPVTGEDQTHVLRLTVRGAGRGTASDHNTASDTVNVMVKAGPSIGRLEFIGTPGGRDGPDPVYALGEWVEVAFHFNREVRVDTTAGVPSVTYSVAFGPSGDRTAVYRRGSGTSTLVFGYRVEAEDSRAQVVVVANSLTLNGATVVGISDGGHAALGHEMRGGGPRRRINGSRILPGTGICDRDPAIAAAIVAKVREGDASVTSCAVVTQAHVAGLTGTLDVSAQVASARADDCRSRTGDFAGLGALTGLDLDNHAITAPSPPGCSTPWYLAHNALDVLQPGGGPGRAPDPPRGALRPASVP